MNYAFVEHLKQAQSSPDTWADFQQRMASYLVKQPRLSSLLGTKIDELDSEYTLCPCGKGFLIVQVEHPQQFWRPDILTAHLACPYCQTRFQMTIHRLQPKLAIAPDVTVEFTDADNTHFELEPQTRGNWRFISWGSVPTPMFKEELQ